jgi:hypothetical protein
MRRARPPQDRELHRCTPDAHQNAALLHADIGEKQLAVRHFSPFRRLQALRLDA